jgi:O-antigen ligase
LTHFDRAPQSPQGILPKMKSLGWLITFILIPFGTSTLGLLFLLVTNLVHYIKRFFSQDKNRMENSLPKPKIVIWINRFFLFLLGIMFISAFFSSRPWLSLQLSLGAALLMYIFVFTSQELGGADNLSMGPYIPALIIASLIMSPIAVFRFFTLHLDRAVNVFTDANSLGMTLIVITGYAIGYLLMLGKRWYYLIIPYLLLVLPPLLFSMTRAAWMGFITTLGLIALFRKKFVLILIVIVLIAGAVFFTTPFLRDRMISAFSVEDNMGRIYIWQSTARMIRDYPIFGVGAGQYQSLFNKYAMPGSVERDMVWAHNIFLEFWVEFGIFALILFTLILGTILFMGFRLVRTGNAIYQGIFAAFIGVLVQAQLDLPFWRFDHGGGAFWLFFGLIIGFYQYEWQKGGFTRGVDKAR